MLFRLLGVLVLAGSLALGWVIMEYHSFLETPLRVPPKGMVYTLTPGTSLGALAQELAQRGVIRHPRFLVWLGRRAGYAARIQAGEYRLTPGMHPEDLLRMLVAGRVVQHSLTLVEGWTFREVRAAVKSDPVLHHELNGLSDAQIMKRLGHPGRKPEGLFYPDTYRFPRGTTDLAFLERAYRTMQHHLDKAWARRAKGLPLKSPYQALILASIVEKETAVPRERPRIAGVFIRRLERGMRLQADPTVIYGLGRAFDGDLHTRDLRHDTPYNTYTRGGLPPTPIAMPGGASIHAVLHPAAGDALYFVARGDGTHVFSRTLAEHDRAVRRYQLHQGSAGGSGKSAGSSRNERAAQGGNDAGEADGAR